MRMSNNNNFTAEVHFSEHPDNAIQNTSGREEPVASTSKTHGLRNDNKSKMSKPRSTRNIFPGSSFTPINKPAPVVVEFSSDEELPSIKGQLLVYKALGLQIVDRKRPQTALEQLSTPDARVPKRRRGNGREKQN